MVVEGTTRILLFGAEIELSEVIFGLRKTSMESSDIQASTSITNADTPSASITCGELPPRKTGVSLLAENCMFDQTFGMGYLIMSSRIGSGGFVTCVVNRNS